MSKAKFEAASVLIKEKNYAAARAVLRTMPDEPRAIEWLAKIDQIAPEEQSEPTRRGGNALLITVIAVLVLLIVGSGVAFTQRERIPAIAALFATTTPVPSLTPTATETATATNTLTATLTYTPTPTPECTTSKQDNDAVQHFLDTAKIGAVTSRIALAPLLLDMQKQYRDFQNAQHSPCLSRVTENLRQGMSYTSDALQAFAGKDEIMTSVDIDLGSEKFSAAWAECELLHIQCDFRLADTKLFIWDIISSTETPGTKTSAPTQTPIPTSRNPVPTTVSRNDRIDLTRKCRYLIPEVINDDFKAVGAGSYRSVYPVCSKEESFQLAWDAYTTANENALQKNIDKAIAWALFETGWDGMPETYKHETATVSAYQTANPK